MNKFFLLCLSILLLQFSANAQNAATLDSTFNGTGIALLKVNQSTKTSMHQVLLQPDGKSIMIGNIQGTTYSTYRTAVARYNTNGTPDSTFNGNGVKVIPQNCFAHSGHLLADGSIMTIATDISSGNAISFAKLKSDGTMDTTFGNNGILITKFYELANENVITTFIDPDSNFFIIGTHQDLPAIVDRGFIAKFKSDGTPDSLFGEFGLVNIDDIGTSSKVSVRGGGVQPDGKVILTGKIGNTVAEEKWYLVRVNADGSFDDAFGDNGQVIIDLGVASEVCEDVLFLPDGKFIAAGYAQLASGYHFTMLRLNNDGSRDMTYGTAGKAQVGINCCYSGIFDIEQQADGKIIACGYASNNNLNYDFAVARFNANGTINGTFGTFGKIALDFQPDNSQRATSIAIQPNGKILVAGYTSLVGEFAGTGVLVRLLGTPITSGTEDIMEQNFAQNLQLSPNPVAGNLMQLAYSLEEESTISLELFDLTGRRIKAFYQNQTRQEGEQTELIELPENLIPGMYYLTLSTGIKAISVKLVKLP